MGIVEIPSNPPDGFSGEIRATLELDGSELQRCLDILKQALVLKQQRDGTSQYAPAATSLTSSVVGLSQGLSTLAIGSATYAQTAPATPATSGAAAATATAASKQQQQQRQAPPIPSSQ